MSLNEHDMSGYSPYGLAAIVDRIGSLRSRALIGMERAELVAGFEEALEQLATVIEELQASNEELRVTAIDLEFERARYRDLFHAGPDGHMLTDVEGTIVEANDAAELLAGGGPRELAGRQLAELVVPGGASEVSRHLRRLRDGLTGETVWTLRQPNGGTRLVRVRYLPLAGGSGGVAGAQWLVLDLEQPMFDNEDRQADSAHVVLRWLQVYGQLTSATEAMIDEALATAESLEQPARRAFEDAHIRPLDGRLEHLRRGLAHWRRRHAALMHLVLEAGELRHAGRTARMSHREVQLLSFLLARPGTSFTPAALLVRAWHSSYLAEEQLRTYIVRVRRKLASVEAPCSIVNRRGAGYALLFEQARPER